MASKTEIANMALSHIGEGDEVQNVDTDNSKEATACRRFYDVAVDKVLRDRDWSFAVQIAAFNVVETAPNLEWGFSYRYPANCLKFRYIVSGVRYAPIEDQARFSIGVDNSGKLIFTDEANMQGAYTAQVTNPGLFPPDFVMALSYYLAYLVLPRISAGDPYGLKKTLLRDYMIALSEAGANDANEEQRGPQNESEFIRART